MAQAGASKASLHRIVVDDTDAQISYDPNQWFPSDINQLNPLGNLGPVWNNTIQRTSVDGATFTFPFNGTAIDVLGTIQVTTLPDGTTDPSWVCLVDEIQITNGTNPKFQFPENNWILCQQETLLPGSHKLTVHVRTKGQPFYLDSIIYTPMPEVSTDGAVLEYLAGDPAIKYGKGWQFYTVESTQNITQTKGSQVEFDFRGNATAGTTFLLTGYIPQELPHNATTATYTLDSSPPSTFTLSGLPPNGTTTLFNMPILSLSGLAPQDHKLIMTYQGDSGHTPLVVKNFYAANFTPPAVDPPISKSSSGAGPGSTGGNQDNSATSHSSSSPAGAIAGGVVGGLVILAILAFLFFWLRRRKRRSQEDTPAPARGTADPFGIETAEVGGAGGGAARSVSTGATYGGTGTSSGGAAYGASSAAYGSSSAAGSSSQHDPFDPYADTRAREREPPVTAAGQGQYPYQYAAVPHARTLSGGGSSSNVAAGAGAATGAAAVAFPHGSSPSPPSSSSGGAAAPHPPLTPLRAVNPTSHSHSDSGSNSHTSPTQSSSPSDLAAATTLQPQRRTKAQEAGLAGPQRRVVVQRHQDSGVRYNSTPSLLVGETEVVDLPPDYSRD
ncbi:hypothetical protein R3P38DRAFT_3390867 [Favolaschia claudopus]|uniref:Uncharacterized protein n=1 Tax=Favolaschia claudopus TaxID=2862362 RepID=A0AAW0CLU7_9AGAR